ncbi:MAG: hypothetical protein RIT45_1059 [Pseudomonadota bacterium]
MTPRRREALGLAAAAIAGYVRSFDVPFIWDDLPHIANNAQIRAPLGSGAWLHAGTQETRPLLNLSFAVNHAIFGLAPAGWHATNVLLHVLAVWALSAALRALFRRRPGAPLDPDADAFAPRAAAAGALLFAVHPLATEAVTYINSRSVVAATAAMAAAFWALERRRAAGTAATVWQRALPGALLAFGLLWKEMAVTLPALVLVVDALLPPRDTSGTTLPWRTRLRGPLALLPALLVLPILFAFFRSPHTQHIGFSVAEPIRSAATQPIALARLAALALLPVGQNLDHDLPLVPSPLAPESVLALVGWALAVVSVWRVRHRSPLPLLGVLAFLLVMAPTNSVVPFYDAMCERHLYPGLAVVCAGGGAVLARLADPPGSHRRAMGATAALTLVLLTLTLLRNELWRDPRALWRDAAAGSPHKARPAAQLGAHLARDGDLDQARPLLERAVALAPEVRPFRENLGLLYRLQGRPEAELALWQARVDAAPDDAVAARILARLRRRAGVPPPLEGHTGARRLRERGQ